MFQNGLSVLIVEDEPVTAISLQTRIEMQGHDVVGVATTGEEAFHIASVQKPDVVLLDVALAGKASGIDVARRIQKQAPGTALAFLTSSDDPVVLQQLHELNPTAVLRKPAEVEQSIHIGSHVLSV